MTEYNHFDPEELAHHLDNLLSGNFESLPVDDPLMDVAQNLMTAPPPMPSVDALKRMQAKMLEANARVHPDVNATSPAVSGGKLALMGTVAIVAVIGIVVGTIWTFANFVGTDSADETPLPEVTSEITDEPEVTETATLTLTLTSTATPTDTPTLTPTNTETPSSTPTLTPSATPTATTTEATGTSTATPSSDLVNPVITRTPNTPSSGGTTSNSGSGNNGNPNPSDFGCGQPGNACNSPGTPGGNSPGNSGTTGNTNTNNNNSGGNTNQGSNNDPPSSPPTPPPNQGNNQGGGNQESNGNASSQSPPTADTGGNSNNTGGNNDNNQNINPTQDPNAIVVICHRPNGNPNNGQTLEVPWSAWVNGHSNHPNDTLGPCE